MGIREYYQNLFRINSQEIPALPPFAANQAFRDDEFVDIILFGTPTSWAREMDRQGFDPMDNTAEEVVAFMEQLESAEVHDKGSADVKSNKANKSSSSKKKNGWYYLFLPRMHKQQSEEAKVVVGGRRCAPKRSSQTISKY